MSQSPRRGMVLVVVLVVIAMLTLAAFTFSEMMLNERKAAKLFVRQAQARELAASGVEMFRMFMTQDPETRSQAGGVYDNPDRFQGVQVLDGDTPADRGRFTLVAPRLEDGLVTDIRYGVEDESARINLNTILLAEQISSGSGRGMLMALPGMTDDLADSILDWLDTDDDARQFGAESDYYSSLSPSYAPTNGPVQTMEELLLVRGVTPALLFGPDANRNGVLDPSETPMQNMGEADNSDGSMNSGWASMLTLHSLEANVQPDGTTPKINLNGSDMNKLFSDLEQALDAEQATFIVAYRQNGPASGATGVAVDASSVTLDLTQPGKTQLKSILDLIGASVQVTSGQGSSKKTQLLRCPFSSDTGGMDSYLPQLMDMVTIYDTPTIPGRININQASKAVLTAIPGMTSDMVDAILSQRSADPTDQPPGRAHETWLLSEGIVTLEQMKALMPFVTASGSVFRVQAVGFYDAAGPSARIEAIIDTTTKPPRVLSWREMTHLGRGFTPDVLANANGSTGSSSPMTH